MGKGCVKLVLLCEDKQIRLRLEDTERKSILITGCSRMGKTFFASNLAAMLIQQHHMVHLIDLGNKWSVSEKKHLQSVGAVTQRVIDQGIELIFHSAKELVNCAKVILSDIDFQSANANSALKRVLQKLVKNEGSFFFNGRCD